MPNSCNTSVCSPKKKNKKTDNVAPKVDTKDSLKLPGGGGVRELFEPAWINANAELFVDPPREGFRVPVAVFICFV